MPRQYPARVSDHGFWAVQSLVTEPGPAAAAIDQLPSDLGALRAASRQLVFHYWADGDYAANGIAPERISEIDAWRSPPPEACPSSGATWSAISPP